MTDRDAILTELEKKRIELDLDFASRFVRELVADPDRLDQLPSGATVFVAPPDDADEITTQTARALRAAEQGRTA